MKEWRVVLEPSPFRLDETEVRPVRSFLHGWLVCAWFVWWNSLGRAEVQYRR
jgi:hypothetical protein